MTLEKHSMIQCQVLDIHYYVSMDALYVATEVVERFLPFGQDELEGAF